MELYHFSEEPGIARFEPRPVAVPAQRLPGMEWLNGPLVWAIDGWHSPMYFFPRDCPRILLWPTEATSDGDRQEWFGHSAARMIAYIEWAWFGRVCGATVHRYCLRPDTFTDLHDAGMWVSHEPVAPVRVEHLDQLPGQLETAGVELRVAPSLVPLRDLWETSLHVSGIRLRNAVGWAS